MAELHSIAEARRRREDRAAAVAADHAGQPKDSILIRVGPDGFAYSLCGIPASSRRLTAQALSKVLTAILED
ncbi:hypothetical protein K7G19_10660 [Cupriavidus sp. DB3]|uniref:hypothetical protein n=1 Tax=Cupriavidus sp. DB3 TaxID=2873259 RepID=UPI001CF4DB6F|nr:hypothetical protein [Cupriavidus sp. DB3]MCA7084066.1 hypothetical protein [Cupriavidus sp. DB3]